MSDQKKRAIRYTGPAPEVEIGPTGQLAERGKGVEVDAELAKSLLEQDVWESASTKSKED